MSICIECAISHHDFEEILRSSNGEGVCNERALPEAWIDGRKYKLGPVAPYHVACDQCHRVTSSLFMPDDRDWGEFPG
jgi:hypothetical protein